MADSHIDKRIKNARLAVDRARAGLEMANWTAARERAEKHLAAVEKELAAALRRKDEMKVTRR